jgi:hypothetical protein
MPSLLARFRPGFYLFASWLFLPALAMAQEPLEKLRAGFDEAFNTQVIVRQKNAQADLDAKYLASVQAAQQAAQQAGKTTEAIAYRDEKKRFSDHAPLPDADPADTPAQLKNMQQKYLDAVAALQVTTDAAATPLIRKYDAALSALETGYTKAGQLDQAQKVHEERGYLKIRQPLAVDGGDAGVGHPGGQPSQVSAAGLTSRHFVYGVGDTMKRTALATSLELGADGKILYYKNPNEVTWQVDDGHLKFLGDDGKVTAIFRDPRWKNGVAFFLGESKVTGKTVFFDEVSRLSSATKTVGEKRMVGHSFILSPMDTTTSDHWIVTFRAGGKFDGDGANFSWEFNKAGALVLHGLGGSSEPQTFSEVYTWEDGKKMYLTTPKTKDGQYRLLETL